MAESEEMFAVLLDKETKRVSILPARALAAMRLPTALLRFDATTTTIIADDFSKADAQRYARVNTPDPMMTTEQEAREGRARGSAPYAQMPSADFEHLFHRMTKEEFLDRLAGIKEDENAEAEAKRLEREAEAALRKSDCTGLKVLFLYGYGNSKALVEREQVQPLKDIFPNATIDVLEGNLQLTKREHLACIEDNHPNLLRLWKDGGVPLYCYAYHEVPPASKDDQTIQTCKGQKLQYAKPTLMDTEAACERVAAHMIANGGYHAIFGFSCGGEIVSMLLGKLAEVNDKAAVKTTMVGLFGVRCLYDKYGSPLEGRLPAGLKVVHVHGCKDNEDARSVDLLADQAEFKERLAAVGLECATMVFDGGHEMPKLNPSYDRVYTPMKRFFAWQPTAATGDA